jgi:hypothetical protein
MGCQWAYYDGLGKSRADVRTKLTTGTKDVAEVSRNDHSLDFVNVAVFVKTVLIIVTQSLSRKHALAIGVK